MAELLLSRGAARCDSTGCVPGGIGFSCVAVCFLGEASPVLLVPECRLEMLLRNLKVVRLNVGVCVLSEPPLACLCDKCSRRTLWMNMSSGETW